MKRKIISILIILSMVFTYSALAVTDPDISAPVALVVDGDGGHILYEKNADERRFPASTTKMMTAIIAIEQGNMDDVVTVSKTALADLYAQGSGTYLHVDEQLTLKQLVSLLMVASSNDAANAIAEHIAGSNAAFAELMNKRASELGCTGTHFVNPHGLHDANHYTTARDLYTIAKKGMEYPLFAELVSTQKYILPATNKVDHEQTFYTTNNLISPLRTREYLYSYANGIKTGSTTPAGYCLVSHATKGDQSYYAVVLGCERKPGGTIMSFVDSKALFEWAFSNYSKRMVLSKSEPVKDAPVSIAKGTDHVVLTPQSDVNILVANDLDISTLEKEIIVEDNIRAPIEKGQTLGSVTLLQDGKEVALVPLVASTSVDRSIPLLIIDKIGSFFKSMVFRVVLVIVIVLIILLIITVSRARRNRRRSVRGYGRSRWRRRR